MGLCTAPIPATDRTPSFREASGPEGMCSTDSDSSNSSRLRKPLLRRLTALPALALGSLVSHTSWGHRAAYGALDQCHRFKLRLVLFQSMCTQDPVRSYIHVPMTLWRKQRFPPTGRQVRSQLCGRNCVGGLLAAGGPSSSGKELTPWSPHRRHLPPAPPEPTEQEHRTKQERIKPFIQRQAEQSDIASRRRQPRALPRRQCPGWRWGGGPPGGGMRAAPVTRPS